MKCISFQFVRQLMIIVLFSKLLVKCPLNSVLEGFLDFISPLSINKNSTFVIVFFTFCVST